MHIVIELDNPLGSLAEPDSRAGAELRSRLMDRIGRWLEELGIPAAPKLGFGVGNRRLGPAFLDFAVLVNGGRCPFDRRTILGVYEATVGRVATSERHSVSAVRDWLRATLAPPGNRPGIAGADTAVRFLEEMIFDTLVKWADRLIDRQVASAFLDELRKANPEIPALLDVVDPEFTEVTLQNLVRFPVAVRDLEAIGRWMAQGQEAGWSVAQIAERLFDVLRPGVIDIHLYPETLGRMLPDGVTPAPGQQCSADSLGHEFGEMLGLMCDGLFYELGLHLLHVRCVADADVPETSFRFRLNERLSAMLAGFGEGEILVNDTTERLELLGIAARPHLNPVSGQEWALIPAQHREEAEQAGLTTWTPFGHVILALASEVRRAAPRLLSVEDVDAALAMLHEEVLPTLVEAVRAEMSSLQVTQVLRHLLGQGIGIRNLRSILELLLDFRYTTGFRAPTGGWGGREPYVYVGDLGLHEEPYFTDADPYHARFDLSTLQLGGPVPAAWLENGRIQAEFVKCGMRTAATFRVARGQNTVICYVVDPEIEHQLREGLASGWDPSRSPAGLLGESNQLLMAIAAEDNFGLDLPPVVFIAGPPEVALAIQDVISEDFPELTVVHRQMLDSAANVQPLARIPGTQRLP